MKILNLGPNIAHEEVKNANVLENFSFLDYDAIILDLNRMFGIYCSKYNVDRSVSKPLFNREAYSAISEHQNILKRNITDALSHGKSIFVYTPILEKYYYQYYQITYGTQNKRLKEVTLTNFDILPTNFEIFPVKGENVQFIKNNKNNNYQPLHTMNNGVFFYDSYFEKHDGTPFLNIGDTSKTVGFHKKYENGNIIFVPRLKDYYVSSYTNSFVESILQVVENLNPVGEVTLPEWSENYYLPGEKNKKNNLEELKSQVDQLQTKIKVTTEELSKLNEKKVLFCSDGFLLEEKVGEIFSELGFELMNTECNRDDLILKYGEKIAVVEIKGLGKSAGEKNAAQLEKWISTYLIENEITPKGILVINGFKNDILEERKEVFPKQMLKFSEPRNHCLIAGINLLNIYFEFLENPDKKEELIDLIFSTAGVLDVPFKHVENLNGEKIK